PHEWHQQDRRIQVLSPLRLDERLQILMPEVFEDILSYRVARSQPSAERRRKRAFLRKPQCSIKSHPAQQTGVQEFSRPAPSRPFSQSMNASVSSTKPSRISA